MATEDCVFCKIVAGEIPCFKLYEDEHTLAFMDINPASRGHALAIPKKHEPNLLESTDGTLAVTIATARKVARAVQATVNPDGINLVQANGPGAAQSVFHLHLHVIPRVEGDELKLNWGVPPKPGDMEAIRILSEKIAASIEA
ncbi:MAG: HIT family protein [Gammaproteobacteria bacterium]|nr:HIT family protein [Gammaproteobacteria bacterium]